jgi:spore maturation protein CgeB
MASSTESLEAAVTKTLLYIGEIWPGSTSAMRAEALAAIGFQVTTVPSNRPPRQASVTALTQRIQYRLRMPPDPSRINAYARNQARCFDVLWIDKGNVIRPGTLSAARRANPRLKIIGYSPDDMVQRHCTSIWFHRTLREYDAYITTKTFNCAELTALGCPRVVFSPNAYDPATHRPLPVTADERRMFGSPVGFIGGFEQDRAEWLMALAKTTGMAIAITGPGWDVVRRSAPANVRFLPSAFDDDYAKRICATDINLGFLRKCNRDQQTQRSVEIPACGGFLLAERTDEHEALFREGCEAEYFSTREELVTKVRRYLDDPSRRSMIAEAGHRRCIEDNYSYAGRLSAALAELGISPIA